MVKPLTCSPRNIKKPKAKKRRFSYSPIDLGCVSCHRKAREKNITQIGNKHHSKSTFIGSDNEFTYTSDGSTPLYLQDGRQVTSLDGTISCSTCHNPHQWDPNNAGNKEVVADSGDKTTSFLRVNNTNNSLCKKCHLTDVATDPTWFKKRKDKTTKETQKDTLRERDDLYDETLEDPAAKTDEYVTSIEIHSPLDKAIINDKHIIISGSIEDTTIKSAILLINGSARQIEVMDGLFSIPGKFIEGRNTIKVVATNAIGQSSSSEEIETMLDTRKPKIIEYIYPKPVTITNNFRVKLVFDMPLSPDSLPAVRLVGSKKSPKMTPLIGSASAIFQQKSKQAPPAKDWMLKVAQGDIKLNKTVYGGFDEEPVVAVRDINKSHHPGAENDQIRISLLSSAESTSETVFLYEHPAEEGLFWGTFGFSTWEEENDGLLYAERGETNSVTVLYDLSDFDITNMPNDTFLTPGIVLDESMAGDITIIVEEAIGINGNKMDSVATESFSLNPSMIYINEAEDVSIREAPISRLRDIHIDVSVGEAVETIISEDPTMDNATWHPYTPEEVFEITPDSGLKRIYILFRNKYGDLSDLIKKETYYIPTDYKDVLKGPIFQNTVLKRFDGPFLIEDDLIIETGATLTLEPGVQILAKTFPNRKIGIYAKGILNAKGTEDLPITFTSNNLEPTRSDWSGITIYSSDSELEYGNVSFAENAITCNGASPYLGHMVYDQIAENTILCTNNSSPHITFNEIKHSKVGIYCRDSSSPRIDNSLILVNEIGVVCSEFSSPKILNNNISDQEIGIYCLSFSSPPIADNNIVRHTKAGILVYQSSPMIYQNNLIENLIGVQCVKFYQPFLIRNNNLHNNKLYGLKMDKYRDNILAASNWWGVTQPSLIDEYIYDGKDRRKLGLVNYAPFLSGTTVPKNACVNIDLNKPTVKDIAFPTPVRLNVPLNFTFLMSESLNPLVNPTIILENTAGKILELKGSGTYSSIFTDSDSYTSEFFQIENKAFSGQITLYLENGQDLTGNIMPRSKVTTFEIDGSVILKNGAYVKDQNLALKLNVEEYSDYMISTDPNFREAKWKEHKKDVTYNLAGVDGKKDIYIKFRTATRQESRVNHQTLWLDRAAPRVVDHQIKMPTPQTPFSLNMNFSETLDMRVKPKITLISSSGKELDVSAGRFGSTSKINDTFNTAYFYLEDEMGGMITIDIRGFVDLAGNEIIPAIMKDIFEYDIVPPSTMAEVKGGANTTTRDIVLVFKGIEESKGMKIKCSEENLDKAPWQDFKKEMSFKISEKKDEDKSIYVQLIDASGNISEVQKLSVTYDTQRPEVISYNYPKPVRISDDFSVTIQFSEGLNVHNPPKVKLITTGSGKPAVAPGGAFSKTKLENDTYTTPPIAMTKEMGGAVTIVVTDAQDMAGNAMRLTTKETFNFDTRAPVATDISVLEGTFVVANNIKVLLNVVGVKEMRYSLDPEFTESEWMEYAEEVAYNLPENDNLYKIYFQFKDNRNNVSETQRIEVKLDRTPPIVDRHELSIKTPEPDTAFSIDVFFGEEINTSRVPSIVLMSTNNASYLITGEGQFFSDKENNDAYRTPPIIFGSEMKGAITLIMDNVQDMAGNRMTTYIKRVFHFMTTDPDKSGIKVNTGEFTHKTKILILSKRKGIKMQLLSEDPDFIGARWKKFKPKTKFKISPEPGQKVVYIKYKDNKGNALTVETIHVYLDQVLPKIDRYDFPVLTDQSSNRITIYFTESMNPHIEPTIVLTDTDGNSIKAPTGGEFITTKTSNDTYVSRRLIKLGGLSSQVVSYVSGGEDLSGNKLKMVKSKTFNLRPIH